MKKSELILAAIAFGVAMTEAQLATFSEQELSSMNHEFESLADDKKETRSKEILAEVKAAKAKAAADKKAVADKKVADKKATDEKAAKDKAAADKKAADKNTSKVSAEDKLNDRLSALKKSYPKHTKVFITNDGSVFLTKHNAENQQNLLKADKEDIKSQKL